MNAVGLAQTVGASLFVSALLFSSPQTRAETDSPFKEDVSQSLYQRGCVAESLGQVAEAQASFKAVADHAATDSPYQQMAARKICGYSAIECKRVKNSQEGPIHLQLFVGLAASEKIADIPKGSRLKGNFKDIVQVDISSDQQHLELTPFKKGVSSLTVVDENGVKIRDFIVEVADLSLHNDALKIGSLLENIDGITVRIIGDRVAVDGQVVTGVDLKRVASALSLFDANHVANLVTLSPLAQRMTAQMIANDVNDPEITVRAVDGQFILEGSASTQNAKDGASKIAQLYAASYSGKNAADVVNLIVLKPAPSKVATR